MATKKQIEKAASKRMGQKCMIREVRSAPTAAERELTRQQIATLKARKEAITVRLKELRGSDAALLAAAQFVVDVNGDNPSIPQLADALKVESERVAILAEYSGSAEEIRHLSGTLHKRRYEIYYHSAGIGGVSFTHIVKGGDTLEELEAAYA